MRLGEVLTVEVIKLELEATDKEGVIKELVDILIETKKINEEDREGVINALIDREKLMSTGIGYNVAIPHAKYNKLPQEQIIVVLGRSSKGVEFQSLDKEPVYLLFLLLTGENTSGNHLKILAKISRLLKQHYIRDQLMQARTREEIYGIIRREEAKL